MYWIPLHITKSKKLPPSIFSCFFNVSFLLLRYNLRNTTVVSGEQHYNLIICIHRKLITINICHYTKLHLKKKLLRFALFPPFKDAVTVLLTIVTILYIIIPPWLHTHFITRILPLDPFFLYHNPFPLEITIVFSASFSLVLFMHFSDD